MALVRFCYAADLPGPELLMKRLQSGEPLIPNAPGSAPSGQGGGASARGATAVQMRPVQQAIPNPQTFDEVLQLISDKRDIGLRVDVERFVRLVAFRPGAITFEPAPNAPGDLVRKLSMKLREWTGQRWLIATEGGGGAETVMERDGRERDAAKARLQANPFVAQVLQTFPGAEITAVRAKPKPVVVEIEPVVPEDERPDIDKEND
jgi:DNA polymerase-3 subunit gamma/tau